MTARGRFLPGSCISSATLVIWTKPRYEMKISPVVGSEPPEPVRDGRLAGSARSAPTTVNTARKATAFTAGSATGPTAMVSESPRIARMYSPKPTM